MTAWQPIETAPKDGTKILIGRQYWVHAAYFGPAQHAFSANSDETYPWVILDATNGTNAMLDDAEYGPTHWQPYPEPPVMP